MLMVYFQSNNGGELMTRWLTVEEFLKLFFSTLLAHFLQNEYKSGIVGD